MTPVLRIVLGLLVAVGGIAILSWWVQRAEAAPGIETVSRGQTGPGAVPTGRGSARRPADAPDTAREGRLVLNALVGTASAFHLAAELVDLPPGCAPVLRIAAGGAVSVPGAAPLPSAPGPAEPWPRVGIVLPVRRLADLGPGERASLLAVWSRFTEAGRLAPERVHLHGCRAAPAELDRLLRWLR